MKPRGLSRWSGRNAPGTLCVILFAFLLTPVPAQKPRIPSPPGKKKKSTTVAKKAQPKPGKGSAAGKKSPKKATKNKVKVKEPSILFPRPSVVIPRPIGKRKTSTRKKAGGPVPVIPGPRKHRPDVREPATIRVFIPGKGKPEVVKKRIEPFKGIRDFPELQFNAFLNMLEKRAQARKKAEQDALKKRTEPVRARDAKTDAKDKKSAEARKRALALEKIRARAEELRKLNEELITILPPGKYRFEDDCGLELSPDARRGNYLLLLCLNSKLRLRHAIRNYRKSADHAWLDYPALRRKRKLRGVLELGDISLKETGAMEWSWSDVKIAYADPYLNVLRRKYPQRPEAVLLGEKSVSRVIDELLRLAVEQYESGADWQSGLGRVLRPGMSINFAKACPLDVKSRPRSEPGVGRVRLRLELSCISGHSLSQVELVMPRSFGAENRELWFQGPGRIHARLQYSRIFKGGDQFYMVWDTIKGIRSLEKKNVDEKKQ